MKYSCFIVFVFTVSSWNGNQAQDNTAKQSGIIRNEVIINDIVLSEKQVEELANIYGIRPQPVGYGF